MKKKLLSIVALLCAVTAWGQEDVTSQYLQNADFSDGTTGWSFSTTGGSWASPEQTPKVVEAYAGWGSLEMTAFSAKQTVTLPAGSYRLDAYSFYRYGLGYNTAPTTSTAELYAGENKKTICTLASVERTSYANDKAQAAAEFAGGNYLNSVTFVVSEDNAEIEIGVTGTHEIKQSWFILGPFKLYKYSLEAFKKDYDAVKAQAEALYETPMEATVLDALKAAVVDDSGFTTSDEYNNAIATLQTALDNAKASVAAYSNLKEALDGVKSFELTLAEDAEAKTTFQAAIAEVESAYAAGTITAEEVAGKIETVNAAFIVAVKAQTAPNSNMSPLIVNNDFESGRLDGWTSTTGAQNNAIASNKSGDITGKFYENWNRDPYSGTMSQTITNLPNGKYTVKIAAFRSGGTGEVYVFANDGQTLVETDNGVYYEATGTVLDGTLTFGLKSVNGGCNWMGLDNVSLTYMGVDLSALVEKLTAAREEATTLKNSESVMSSLCRAALDDALTATENVAEEETALTEALLKVSAAVDAANKSIASNAIFAGGSVASNSIENWTYTGENTWHVNTWSSEGNSDGSNMTTPFLEVWRSAGTNLSNGSVFYTLEGMEPGLEYTATALVRVLNEKGTATTGLSMFANDAKQVIEGGEACDKGFYTTSSVTGVVGEDGVLKFGFDIADATFNWIAFKNITIAPKKVETVYDLVPTEIVPAEGEVENFDEFVVLTCENDIYLDYEAVGVRVYNMETEAESEFAMLDDSNVDMNQLMLVFDPTIATPGSTIVVEIPAGMFGDKDWSEGKGGHANQALKYTYKIAAASAEFALESAIWKETAESEGINMVDASLDQLTKGATITINANKPFGYATWTISNETDGTLKQGYIADRTPETSCELTMRGAATKLLQGQTYTLTIKAYETEADARGGAEPNVGTITFNFTGTQSAYVYSEVKFTNEVGKGVVLNSKEENTYVLTFDAPVTVKKAMVNLGQGVSDECNVVSNETGTEWTVTLSSPALGQYDTFDLNVFAEDKEGHAVNKTADAPVMGSEDNTWFTISFICDFNKPDFVVTPASETTVESIETITFSYNGGIAVSGSSTVGEITITDVTIRGQEKVVATFSVNDLQYPEGYDPEDFKDNKCLELHIDLAEPITAVGKYQVEVPAGFFVLGEQFESSSSKLTTIYYEVAEPVETLNIELNPAGGNVSEIPATIVLTVPNRNTINFDYTKVPTLTDSKNNSYAAVIDLDWSLELNQLVIKLAAGAITADGIYTLTIPAGAVYGDGPEDINTKDVVVVYTIGTVTEPAVLTVSPESETTLESLETVTFSCEGGIAINPEATDKITIYDMANRQEVASFAGDELVAAENALSIVLSEAITAEGNYNVNVPAGFFLLGKEKVANEATTVYYSAHEAIVIDVNPASGIVTEIPATIVVTAKNRGMIGNNYDIVPTLKDSENNSYKVTLDIDWNLENNQLAIYLADGAITKAGTYTLTIPAGAIIGDSETDVNKEIVVVYTIATGDGIDNIVAQAGGKVDVYTVNGTCVLRNADAAAVKALRKGLYIINGKKVMLK